MTHRSYQDLHDDILKVRTQIGLLRTLNTILTKRFDDDEAHERYGSMPNDGNMNPRANIKAIVGIKLWADMQAHFSYDDWWLCDPEVGEPQPYWWQKAAMRSSYILGAKNCLVEREVCHRWSDLPDADKIMPAPWLSPVLMDHWKRVFRMDVPKLRPSAHTFTR